MLEEGVKYAIQMCTKYGSLTKKINNPEEYLIERGPILGNLIRYANLIHSRYTSIGFFDLFQDYLSEAPKGFLIDINMAKADPAISPYFDYFRRLEMHNEATKSPVIADQYINSFIDSLLGHEDLFKTVFHISLAEFGDLIKYLLNNVIEETNHRIGSFPRLSEDIIDYSNPLSAILWGESLLIPKKFILEKFGENGLRAIDLFLFNPKTFDPRNLGYHQTSRTPLFLHDKFSLIVSPELLLDSLELNLHYSLLEAPNDISEAYKARSSVNFVDDISILCSKYNYQEVKRNVQLYESSRQLGDLDLVLRNSDDHYLLIEAKNHALPLNVYFNDIPATKRHLAYLRDNWQKPYIRRLQHLQKNAVDYGISPNFKYIIVTRMPEILSHFSDQLVITKEELPYILPKLQEIDNLSEIMNQIYPLTNDLSDEDMQTIVQEGLSVIRPA